MTGQDLGMRISACLTHMARGFDITVPSGHRLAIAEGDSEPGFIGIRHFSEGAGLHTRKGDEVIYQIGSDVAWLTLIEYAKKMTLNQMMEMLNK